jgi:DNA-binding beta-propeller fold protein YncE
MRVQRCRYDGSGLQTLVQTGHSDKDKEDPRNWCVGIAVDPRRGKMYWTQKGPSKGDQGRLFSANLEMLQGENVSNRSDVKLLFDKLPEPIDLELDEDENVLYMTDRGEIPFGNSISRIKLDDNGVVEKKILVRKLHEAIGLALDKAHGRLFFTDLGGSVYTSALDGSNEVELLHEIGDVTGIACTKA